METSIEQKNQRDWKVRLGNPDFFFIAFLAIVILDISIERFTSGTITLLVAIPIGIIGTIISIFRWRKLSMHQKVFFFVLFVGILLGLYLLLPGL
jgi:uncharacterized membrane protein YobD (UPF0266 family)